ncbi:hypothetical protein [Edwardsiella piscicida]|uniref:hypothetical protein n=1 Tax=Edwardsiella piscicida TaxID=1263550 RepID=UPI00370D6E55
MSESRKEMVARHQAQTATALAEHTMRMLHLYESQRIELADLMLRDAPAEFVTDVISGIKSPLKILAGEEFGSADAWDASYLLLVLDRLEERLNAATGTEGGK